MSLADALHVAWEHVDANGLGLELRRLAVESLFLGQGAETILRAYDLVCGGK